MTPEQVAQLAQVQSRSRSRSRSRLTPVDVRIERIRAEIADIYEEFPASIFVFSEMVRTLLRSADDGLEEAVEYLHMIEDQGDVARG